MWVHPLIRLVIRSFLEIPSVLSSNWLALGASFAAFICPQLIAWGKAGWKLNYVVTYWRRQLKIAVATVIVIWCALFLISMGKSIYSDHESLLANLRHLRQQNANLSSSNARLLDPDVVAAKVRKLEGENRRLAGSLASLQSPAVRIFPLARNERPGVPEMEFILTTGKIRTPVDLDFSCDFAIADAAVYPLTPTGGSVFTSSKRQISANQYELSIEEPAWSPTTPLWLSVFFKGTVNRMPQCKFSVQ